MEWKPFNYCQIDHGLNLMALSGVNDSDSCLVRSPAASITRRDRQFTERERETERLLGVVKALSIDKMSDLSNARQILS